MVRLCDKEDDLAWSEFNEIYKRLIYRTALGELHHDADARDLTQDVLAAAAKKVPEWEHDPTRCRFRTWLFRVFKRTLRNYEAGQRRQQRGEGGTDPLRRLEQQPDPESVEARFSEQRDRQELFEWAAELVRDEFSPRTWQAFWNTSVEQRKIKEVADELDMTVEAVYVARCRVMARLRSKIDQIEGTDAACSRK